jgi:predicted nucleotidyltransferase
MAAFEESLPARGWQRSERLEHRWTANRGSLMDLLTAGENLRIHGRLEWPRRGRTMSLAGFRHVFSDAEEVDLGGGLHFKVVPPCVQALMKVGSYLDDPNSRAKDLLDFRRLLQRYESNSDRIFSDPVFDANLPDVSFATAFLLGYDMRAMLTEQDEQLIDESLIKIASVLEHAPATDYEDGKHTV